ncbi:MAG: SDR family oxidoreductase, partial [Polaromonas sp.]|nr:SDR family oxidoreductase [Polaromonas sp.]
MDLDLKGKSVIVTGGGSNIGRAIVLGFAAEGAHITIGDIDDKQAQKTAEFGTKIALDLMIPRNAGSIVSISSDASRQGEPREAVYGGVKAAINSFMKTIAKENGRYGIRCNVVCPGVTIPSTTDEVGGSSMWVDAGSMFTPEQLEKVAKALPLRKVGRPQDIANAVVFLSSAKVAGHVTGQVLSVSGGYSMIG